MGEKEDWRGRLRRSGETFDMRDRRAGVAARPGAGERPSRLLLLAAFAAVYLIWGSTYLGIKFAIETLPPFIMAGTRFLVAGALLYLWARFRPGGAKEGRERPLPAHWRTAAVVGVLLFLCGNGGVTWAEHHIASGLAALLVATEPLWIVLLGWLLPGGVRPGGKVALGLVLGFAGVWLLVGPGTSAGGETHLIGAAAVIAAAFAWALGSLYSVNAPAPRSPLLASGMQMMAGGALLLLAGVLTGEWARFDLGGVSARSVAALLYLTVFGSLVAFTAYGWLLRHASPARVATYAYVNPVVAVLLGWALAGEPLTAHTLLAAAVIVASVALITSRGKGAGERREAVRPQETERRTAGEVIELPRRCA